MQTLPLLLLALSSPSTAPPSPSLVSEPQVEPSDWDPHETIPVSETGLTADEVAKKAVENAPSLISKAADVEIAETRVGKTVASFVPRVELSAGYTRLSDVNVTFGSGALVGAANEGLLGVGACPDGTGNQCVVDGAGAPVGAASFDIPQILNQFALQAQLSIPISDYVFRLTRGIEAARQSKQAAEAAEHAERRKVAIDARLAYYDWIRAVAQVAATQDAVRTSTARLGDVQLAIDAGVRTSADLKRIEVLVANAKTARVEAEAFEEVARERLSTIMNEPVRQWQVGEDIASNEVVTTVPPKLDVAVSTALQHRPELTALELNDKAIDNGIKTERAAFYPRLDGFAEGTYANPNQRIFPQTADWNGTWSAGLRLSWTINGPLTARQTVKELEAQRRSLGAQEEALRRGIRLEVTQAYVERKNALARIKLAETARAASDEAYRVISLQFREGKATSTDVIEVQGERLTSYIQWFNARIDLRVAEEKLAYTTGETEI